MKKIVSLLLALLLICGLALADSVVATDGSSWVRSGPGTGYAQLALLEDGESAEYLGSTSVDARGRTWYRVRVGGVEGWVSSRYTTLEASGWYDGSWEFGNTRYVRATARVNVRSGPGTSYEALATVSNGDSIQIVESAGDGWYKITFSGLGGAATTGYMKGDYLANQ